MMNKCSEVTYAKDISYCKRGGFMLCERKRMHIFCPWYRVAETQ